MVCAVLMDYGITDVQIENNIQLTDEELNQMYADFVKELPEDDGSCVVSFYLDEKGFIPQGIGTGDSPSSANEAADYEGIYVNIKDVEEGLNEASELFGLQPVTIEKSSVDPGDWNNKWKEYFKPFAVGNILIKPLWEEVPPEYSEMTLVNIDPGMAFGTGLHETTRLCLMALQKYLKKGDEVLDLGTGSGILGIAALKLGASHVTAVDIDEQAVKTAEENFEINIGKQKDKTEAGKSENYRCEREKEVAAGDSEINMTGKKAWTLMTADIINDAIARERLAAKPGDIVLANILAEVIVKAAPYVHEFLKPGGILITSGIIEGKEQLVSEALTANQALEVIEIRQDGDWRSVVARKNI